MSSMQGRMLGICLRYTGDRDTAQDLLHDGFIKIFDSFDKFTWRGEGSLRAWMERGNESIRLCNIFGKNDVMNQSAPLEELPEVRRTRCFGCRSDTTKSIDAVYPKNFPQDIVQCLTFIRLKINHTKEIAQVLGINEKIVGFATVSCEKRVSKRVKEWIMNNG